ncbi:hypothetical protein AYI69_g11457 [Smittium culicis]|uniref:Zn(2)-C6 fungal-type domain-containing protein n=1 Tax=Smittium culicis TaxID=133412 RepID=A0A1R1WYL9_9FUNG|nr:hypothetical protein AYI69_g11457 [Smittium culicis]
MNKQYKQLNTSKRPFESISSNGTNEKKKLKKITPKVKTKTNKLSKNSSKTATHGKNLFTCSFCRKKKLRCDSNRPICGPCVEFDELCKYEEFNQEEEVKEGIASIEQKIKAISSKFKKIDDLCRINIAPDFNTASLNSDSVQKINEPVNQLLLDAKNSASLNCAPQIKLALDNTIDINYIVKKSALELGYLEASDDVLIEIIKKLNKSFIIHHIISLEYFVKRIKEKSIPDHLRFSILSFGAKLAEDHIIFKDHLYICGVNYANKAFDLIKFDRNGVDVDKVLTAGLLSLHYIGISKLEKATFLVGKLKNKKIYFLVFSFYQHFSLS